MDKDIARAHLQSAAVAAGRARRRSPHNAAVFIFLGMLETGLVLGPFLWRQMRHTDPPVTLFPTCAAMVLLGATTYAASRHTTPRHLGSVVGVLGGIAAVAISVTIVVGTVVFPDSVDWWFAGALLSGLPFAMLAVFVRVGRLGSRRTSTERWVERQ